MLFLFTKLRDIGVCTILMNWIWRVLSNSKTCISIRGVTSNGKDVINGVPQGSELGPVLFLVYVNFMTDCIVSKQFAFAERKIY